MLKIKFLILSVLVLLHFDILAQPWTPDVVNSIEVLLKKENGKYGLYNYKGNGAIDSIPPIYDFICKYNKQLGKPVYIGKKDSSWYLLSFKTEPKLIPAKKYIGNGLFMTSKGPLFSIYSCEKGRNVLENLVEYDRDFSDILTMDTSSNVVDFYKPFYYTTGDIKFWVKDKSGIVYWLNYWGQFYFKNANIFKNKIRNKTYYGLKNYGENNNILLNPIYDTVFNFISFTITKNGKSYEVYNSLMKKIADAKDFNYSYCFSDMLIIRKEGKLGLVDYFGEEIFKPIFDSLWIDQFIIAKKNDSLFFYNENGCFITIKKNENATYKVIGDYEFPPFYLNEKIDDVEKKLFIYNPSTETTTNTSMYDDLYFFNLVNGKHLLAAKKENKYGVIDLLGNIVHPFEYDFISLGLMEDYWTFNRFYAISKNGKTGFFDGKLKEIVPSIYNEIGMFNLNNQIIPSLFTLKKDKLWYFFDWKTKKQSEFGFDSIIISENHKYYDNNRQKWVSPFIATKKGETFYIDSTVRKYFNFRFIEVREDNNQVFLEENTLNKTPVNILPNATINSVEDFNLDGNYAIVFCLNRFFVINKYGEMSSGFEKMIEFYDYKNNTVFGSKSKKSKSNSLYNFNGNEIGQLSKYNWTQLEVDTKTQEHYFVFKNTKNKLGLMNAKGELLLDCIYHGIIQSEKGHFDVWRLENDKPTNINPSTLKAIPWKN